MFLSGEKTKQKENIHLFFSYISFIILTGKRQTVESSVYAEVKTGSAAGTFTHLCFHIINYLNSLFVIIKSLT